MSSGDAQAGGRHRTDRDRNVILRWSGRVIRIGQAATDLDQCRLQLFDTRLVAVPGELGVLVLGAHMSRPEAQFKPPCGQDVGGGSHPREQRGIPESDVQDVRAQPHPRAQVGGRGQRRERIRSAEMIGSGDHVAAERIRPHDHFTKRAD